MRQLWKEFGVPEPDHAAWGVSSEYLDLVEEIWTEMLGWQS